MKKCVFIFLQLCFISTTFGQTIVEMQKGERAIVQVTNCKSFEYGSYEIERVKYKINEETMTPVYRNEIAAECKPKTCQLRYYRFSQSRASITLYPENIDLGSYESKSEAKTAAAKFVNEGVCGIISTYVPGL